MPRALKEKKHRRGLGAISTDEVQFLKSQTVTTAKLQHAHSENVQE